MTKIEQIQLKQAALEAAIKSGVGTEYNDNCNVIVNGDKILEAAKKFHEFMKGDTSNG